MNLPKAPDRYDRDDQDRLRNALETAISALESVVHPGSTVTVAASTLGAAGLNLPHSATTGVAPSTPKDGDMWTTTAGLYVRINGVTVGPLT